LDAGILAPDDGRVSLKHLSQGGFVWPSWALRNVLIAGQTGWLSWSMNFGFRAKNPYIAGKLNGI
jgi:hypothetical protein